MKDTPLKLRWDAEAAFKRLNDAGRTITIGSLVDKLEAKTPYTPPTKVADWLALQEPVRKVDGLVQRCLENAAKERHAFMPSYWRCGIEGCVLCARQIQAEARYKRVSAPLAVDTTGAVASGLPSHARPIAGSTPAAPSSDPYEPVGTMPVAGDRYVLAEGSIEAAGIKHGQVLTAKATSSQGVDGWRRECFDHTGDCEIMKFRILKRKPTTPEASVVPRAWSAYVRGCRFLWDGSAMWYFCCERREWSEVPGLDGVCSRPGSMGDRLELPPAEALKLWESCKKELGL
jgi:hypothetical protein